MNRVKLIACLVLASLAIICLISAPVFSIEDPWDVDGSNDNGGTDGSGGNLPDTTDIFIEDPLPFDSGSPDIGSGLFDDFWIQLSWLLTKQMLLGGTTTTIQPVVTTAGSN